MREDEVEDEALQGTSLWSGSRFASSDARASHELLHLAGRMWALRDTRRPERARAWNDAVGACAVMCVDRANELAQDAPAEGET